MNIFCVNDNCKKKLYSFHFEHVKEYGGCSLFNSVSTNIESEVKEEQEGLDKADESSSCRGDTTGICQINDYKKVINDFYSNKNLQNLTRLLRKMSNK